MQIFGIDVIYFWLGLIVVFGILEAFTLNLSAIWFSVGALLAMIFAGLGASVLVQVFAFIVGTTVMLLALKPLVQKLILPKVQKTNLDRIVGEIGVVTVEIDNMKQQGEVKIMGLTWTARSVVDENIAVDTKVKICEIKGVKVLVMPCQPE